MCHLCVRFRTILSVEGTNLVPVSVDQKQCVMRILSTKVHGFLDYMMGILLIISPWVLGFANDGAETWLPVVLGASALVYSIFTNYELGLVKSLSMRTHLTLDFLSGALLAVSPWLFGFADYVYMPHLILGILEMGASLMTRTIPYTSDDRVHTNVRDRIPHHRMHDA
jgi:hypothetical protein